MKKRLYTSFIKEWRFEIMKIRLSSRDVELICFIGRYKQIKSVDCKKIYKSIQMINPTEDNLELIRLLKI